MKRKFYDIVKLYSLEILLVIYIIGFYVVHLDMPDEIVYFLLIPLIVLAIVKIIVGKYLSTSIYTQSINAIKDILENFKKGKFIVKDKIQNPINNLEEIMQELEQVGKHLDVLIVDQKEELEKFRELYNNIVLSVSSYVVALNEKDKIIFANKSFCENFQQNIDELIGRKISDLFFFTAGRVADAIVEARKQGESIILRQARLLSKKRIAIIADIKISRMTVHGDNQIVLVMDDITSRCRKDYQLSLISQISESIQRDDEIDRVLFSILTAVTSGAGLGFNRAMLFLYDEQADVLAGKMGVGPDSVEEAVQIWGEIQSENLTLLQQVDVESIKLRSGKTFYDTVTHRKFPLSKNNILIQTLKTQHSIHVQDVWNDSRVDQELKEFMDVSEFVAVPLISGNRSIGLIVADNKYNNAPIWNESIELLSIFAGQAALSIESCNSLFSVRDQMEKIKARQEAIVETEKLAAVGRIAAHIAHEIRNPLVTVGGYARRVSQLLANPSKNLANIDKAINVIMQESERLEKMLSNVMDFSRPSPYIREYNNLNDIIKDTVFLLKNVLQERKISQKMKLEEGLPLVKSDFNQLKQVMLNLLQNAMDVTPSGGYIEIETGQAGNRVAITVRDSGPGINEDDVVKLFDPFFTTKLTGVGLGLAIVKKIINDHNGEISVRNREHKGAEFRVEFPLPA